jgi:hypothetical protein
MKGEPMTETSTYAQVRKPCRSARCGAEILIVLLDTGNKMPIDPKPNAEGTVVLLPDGRGRVLKKAEVAVARRQGIALYTTHFYTCPEGPQFRKRSRP